MPKVTQVARAWGLFRARSPGPAPLCWLPRADAQDALLFKNNFFLKPDGDKLFF